MSAKETGEQLEEYERWKFQANDPEGFVKEGTEPRLLQQENEEREGEAPLLDGDLIEMFAAV
jgi:hypothetical protein